MAGGDEKIKYDVEIDELSLSAQLDRISQAISSTIANSSAQASVTPGLATSAANYFNSVQSPLTPLDSGIPYGDSNFNLSNVFDSFATSTQLGFQKFQTDYRNIGLTTPPPEHSDALPFQRGQGLMGAPEKGFFGTAGAMFGLGRDPEQITHSRYKQLAQENAAEAASS